MPEGREISIGDIIGALWRRRHFVAAVVAITLFLGLVYTALTQPLYTATVTLQPAVDEGGSPLSGVSGALGQAASFAGVSLGGGGDQEKYVAILRSRELGERFIKEQNLMQHFFSNLWDEEAGEWRKKDPGIIGQIKRHISRILASLSNDQGWRDPYEAPSISQAYRVLAGIRDVADVGEGRLVTVSFEHPNPELAAKWANAYVALANEQVRGDAVQEASRALSYLNSEVKKTDMAGLRDTIFGLVETQLEQIMLTNARTEYAFQVIDHAVVPQEPSHPRRTLMILLSFLFGVVLSVFGAVILEARQGAFQKHADDS